MALRLRRGTDAERLIMEPPAAGELIYTTDTKAVYVGDGTTVGGLPVSGQSLGIDDLGNVTVTAPSENDILKWNGTAWINAPQESLEKPGNIYGSDSTLLIDTDNSVIVGPIVANTPIIGDVVGDITGNLTGDVVGDVTGTLTGNVIGTLDGEMTGSVFGDDSTPIVDGTNNTINAISVTTNSIVADANIKISNRSTIDPVTVVEVASIDDVGIASLTRESETDIGAANLIYGRVAFTRNDVNGPATPSFIAGGRNYIGLFNDPAINAGDISKYLIFASGKLSVGAGLTPTATLEVGGSIRPGVYADADARDAAIPSPVAGEMVFVTDVAKFQGYDGTAWANLN
jgi:hypothetical protein